VEDEKLMRLAWIPKPFFYVMNTGMIIKSKSVDRFTSIDNEIIRNFGLSLEERGLLIFLLSLRHDWVIYKTTLHERVGCSKGTLDRVFKGLQEKGYIISVKVINDSGHFSGWNHVVYDIPTSTNTDVGESAPISNTNTSKLYIKNTKFIRPTASEVNEYAKEIGFISLDSSYFLDHYDSNGWLVGKNPMKDWKAAVRTWKRNSSKFNTEVTQTTKIKLK
jgi:hypothetical protein